LGLIATWSIGRLQAQGDKATFGGPNHAILTEMPSGGRAGLSAATLWGDPNVGATGTYTKFVPGQNEKVLEVIVIGIQPSDERWTSLLASGRIEDPAEISTIVYETRDYVH
jgi:hypothetical protein